MTNKQYIVLAMCVRGVKPVSGNSQAMMWWDRLVSSLCVALHDADNRMDREAFYDMCGCDHD